jgi:HD superfamily phosphodiesterase
LLAEPLPRRWLHVQGVGRKAESIAHIVGDDAETLICAAWLHDVGYAPYLAKTGLHSLDGARYLRDVQGTDDQVCRLIAHHSFAVIEARNRGLLNDLLTEFRPVDGLMADSLTYCDMTTGPDGKPTEVEARLNEILTRYREGSVVAKSIVEARDQIRRSVLAVTSSLGETRERDVGEVDAN